MSPARTETLLAVLAFLVLVLSVFGPGIAVALFVRWLGYRGS